jgi:hypothetical protein
MIFKLCWHKWGKWSAVVRAYGGSLHQARRCEKCGLITTRKAVSMMYTAHLDEAQVNNAVWATKEKAND